MINERTKHIDIAYHFVRQLIEEGWFSPKHIDTMINIADIFTKALSGERTQWLAQGMMGIITISAIEGKKH